MCETPQDPYCELPLVLMEAQLTTQNQRTDLQCLIFDTKLNRKLYSIISN